MEKKYITILIRGMVGMPIQIKKTLEYLRLYKKHNCSVLNLTQENLGMIKKVKDYVTYGTIEESQYKQILEKRGKLIGGKKLDKTLIDKVSKEYFENKTNLREFKDKYKLKATFNLHPPLKGFERKGVKMPFGKGGVLGDRKDKIFDLVKKML